MHGSQMPARIRRSQAKAPALVRVRCVPGRAQKAGSCSNILSSKRILLEYLVEQDLSSKILLEYSYSDGRDA